MKELKPCPFYGKKHTAEIVNCVELEDCENFMSCKECMKDAPHDYCCKLECGEHEFCRGCQKAGY